MKRFIALVLSLVMALSLCVPAWGAASVSTLADLQQAITDGETEITLTAPITIDSGYETISATVPVTITANGQIDAFTVNSDATLTLGANVTITSNTSVLWVNGGTVIIDGAILEGTSTAYALAAVEDSGTIVVKSGKVSSTGTNKTTMDIFGAGGTINVEGGEVYSGDSSALSIGGKNGGTINIYDGATVTTNCAGLPAAVFGYSGTINVYGGTVKNANPANTYPSLIASSDGCRPATVNVYGGEIQKVGILNDATADNMNIEGGTFDVAPNEEYIADGLVYNPQTGEVSAPAPVYYTLTVKHVDEDGNAVADEVTANVEANTPYSTTAKVIDGYEAGVWDESSDVASGTMDGAKTVIYVYAKEPVSDNPTPDLPPATPTDPPAGGDDNTDPTPDLPPATPTDPPAGGDDNTDPNPDDSNDPTKPDPKPDEPADEPVATVDGKEYADFDDAVEDAIDSGKTLVITIGSKYTIKLAAGQSITVKNDADAELNFDVPAGYKVKEVVNADGTVTYKAVWKYNFGGWGGGNTSTEKDPDVNSPKTFDAGIALYVGMSVAAAAGSAVIMGKKRED